LDRGLEKTRLLYDRYRFGDFSYGKQRERHHPLLIEFLSSVEPGQSLYDIGCGTGYWLEAALRHGVKQQQVCAVDLSPGNVAALHERGFNALLGNALGLPLRDNVSDSTVSNGVIHCTPDPFQAFRELVRITRPGGRIFLGVYNAWNPYFYLVHRLPFPLRHLYWHWTPRILDFVYYATWILYQPLAYLALGEFLDARTAKVLLMDQVMVPYAYLFTKSKVRHYAQALGCEVKTFRSAARATLLTAVIEVRK